jgi:hypothetical protein
MRWSKLDSLISVGTSEWSQISRGNLVLNGSDCITNGTDEWVMHSVVWMIGLLLVSYVLLYRITPQD